MSTKQPSRVVFVGNIPYGLSEEQITEIFSSVGTSPTFRLVYDSETGRPKGFGFADYPDIDSASSAVRNLNDYEIMGRKLRVDFSNDQSKSGDDDHTQGLSGRTGNASNGAGSNNYNPQQSSNIPPLPPGKELPAGVKCVDAISQTLNTLPPPQLLDILAQMKALATSEPQRATELLQQAPQLGAAVFQALLLMGLVSPEAIQSVVEQGAPPPVQNPTPTGYPVVPQIPGYPAMPVVNNTPPVAAMPYAPPSAHSYGVAAPAPAAPVAPAAPGGLGYDELMAAVFNLTEEQINSLPESEKQQLKAIKASMAAQRR